MRATPIMWTIAAILLHSQWAGTQDIRLCQRKHGMRIYKREKPITCNSTKAVHEVYIEIHVPDYTVLKTSGHWIGRYVGKCEAHYFFWGSYTHNTWREVVPLQLSDVQDLIKGVCPNSNQPTPILHHPQPKCLYTWLQQVLTETPYCITRPTTVFKSEGHPLASEEEPLDPNSINKGYALTMTGALVTWDPSFDFEDSDKRFIKRYSGKGLIREGILLVEELQEGFHLRKEVQGEGGWESVWLTDSGYKVYIGSPFGRAKIMESIRAKRSNNVLDELVGKLNYEKDLMEKYLERFQTVCIRHTLLQKAMEGNIQDDPDRYAQALLKTDMITASITRDYIVVWPCKRVSSWRPVNSTSTLCSTLIKVEYLLDGTKRIGYLDPNKRIIVHQTNHVNCTTFRPVLYQKAESLYLWNGRGLISVSATDVGHVDGLVSKTGLIPIWNEHWLHAEEDFLEQEPIYVSRREMELRDLEGRGLTTEDLYNINMRVPFMGLPVLPSLSRCFELIALLGGLLHLIKVLRAYISRALIRRPDKEDNQLFKDYKIFQRNNQA